MKTKFKKALLTLCAMVLSVFMFAGCNLIEINKYKYYNQDVAKVGVKDGYGEEYKSYERTYSKKELLQAYYNYAYQYVNQGQLDVKEGVEYAIDNMINADILYNFIKINYFDNGKLEFSKADQNDVRVQAFDAIQASIYELEEEIFEEWNIDFLTADELTDEETKSLRATYTEYTPTVEYAEWEETYCDEVNCEEKNCTEHVRLVGKVVLREDTTRTHESRVAGEHFVQAIRNEDVSREAYTRYIKTLQDEAKAEGVSTDEKTVLEKKEKELIDNYTRARYFEIFEDWYNKNYNFTYNETEKVYVLNDDIVDEVVETFKQEFEIQMDQYSDKEAYHKAMSGDDISKMYYHHSDEYVYVSHILLKFSDAQVAEIKALDKKLEKKLITQERRDELVKNIADRTLVTYELGGKTYTSTAAKVYDRINGYVNKGEDVVERAKLFNDMIYIYNDDAGIMNKDFAYVVNLDTSVQDKMVKPFADKAREMHAEGNVGDMSDIVITEYGVHIMFYAGDVKSVVSDVNSLSFVDLMQQKTQLSSNKSLFDTIYDGINSENYNVATSGFVADIREIISIEYNKDAYKDMFE